MSKPVPSPFHGLLLIDKPSELSSHDVVAQVRRILGTRDVGHTGTLDPLATGLLILVVGEATKLSSLIVGEEKSYQTRIQLGITTDSLDRTGQILSQKEVPNFELPDLHRTLSLLTGELSLEVPLFSAKKVNGQALYKKAHAGEAVLDLPTKPMKFFDISLDEVSLPHLQVGLSCSKGSFIRSWVSELGKKLGCGATVDELRRTRVGHFSVAQAVSLDKLAEIKADQAFLSHPCWVSLEGALVEYPKLVLNPYQSMRVKNGALPDDLRVQMVRQFVVGRDRGFSLINSEGKLLALVANQADRGFYIQRGFNL